MPIEDQLYYYRAKVVEIYDADTVRADVDWGGNTWSMREPLRLYGINAPEVRGEQRPEGIVSRDALRAIPLDQEVIINTIRDKKGKYGRYLARIFLKGVDINNWLVEHGHATKKDYD